MQVIQSTKLANVCYEIRGPVLEEAMRLEAAGHRILKLNTGNPAAFGFECPPEILEDMLRNLGTAHGYGDAKGLLSRAARSCSTTRPRASSWTSRTSTSATASPS